jgi:hypothetical protein
MPKLIAKKKKAEESKPEPKAENKSYENLDSIMNKDRPFSIFFSGVEQRQYFDILYDLGIRDFLMSYHYLQNKRVSLEKEYGDLGVKFFIDSGAFTYMNDPKYSEEYSIEDWENHINRYLKWAEKNKDYIFAIANLDLEYLVGAEQVEQWNRKYFEPFMLRTGIPVCFVWHSNDYISWEYYCKRYPYVGFSGFSDTTGVQDYADIVRTAKQFDTLVHGFGLTQTRILQEVPFYTADSTTWLVGLQYGEINYWNRDKMSRLKKDKWKSQQYLELLSNKYGLDSDKLLAEDSKEMIKANVWAFIDAQKFIEDRLKTKAYWRKAKAINNDVDNLPEDFYPTPEEMSAGLGDDSVKVYAKKMNINPESEDAGDLVYDLTAFMNWYNEDYLDIISEYTDREISDLHDTYVNRIVPDTKAMVDDLIQFYRNCLTGDDETLLHTGTNFDRIVKERDDYIEEEDSELVDISEEDIKQRLAQILPSPEDEEFGNAPEISELDEEIFKKVSVVPTFDENGKFVKGQVSVRKPKQLYSKLFPKVACDTCFAADRCPQYKAGFVCAFDKMFNRFDTRNIGDVIEAMQGMANFNLSRLQIAMLMERINGGLDDDVTNLINQNMNILGNLNRMYESQAEEVLSQTRIMRSDGTLQQTTAYKNPRSGGILEQIFGASDNKNTGKDTVDEIDEDTGKNPSK